MGNVLRLNVNREVRFMLDPSREAQDLDSKWRILRSCKEAVKDRVQELYGGKGAVVRGEVRAWIEDVEKEDKKVSELLKSLHSHTRCFRLVCCCSYALNFYLAEQIEKEISRLSCLQGQHDHWNGNYVWMSPALAIPEEMLQEEMEKLEDARKNLLSLAEDECRSDPPKMLSYSFTTWLKKVDCLANDQGDGEEDVIERSKERIARMRLQIKDLLVEGEKIRRDGTLTRFPERISNLPGSLPEFLVGIEENVSKVYEYLKDSEVDAIGIYGMGGSGKTTLVKEITRRLGLPEPAVHFDLVIPVVVSQSPNIFEIQEDIGVRLGFSRAADNRNPGTKSDLPSRERDRASILSSLLSKMTFLLILDDVWEKVDVEMIGVPSPLDRSRKNSKILLTTRDLNVCRDMYCKEKLRMGRLGEEDSRELFRKIIGKQDLFSSSLREIAEDVLQKCGGLPLAIITVALALANKSDISGWKVAKDFTVFLHGMEDVMKHIKFSFDHLKREEHRSCLLLCALFPQDWDIDIETLVRYWIGEGLLEYSGLTDYEELEDLGRYIVSTLQDACLLEEGRKDKSVKMHNAVRDMAIWLVRAADGYDQQKFLSSQLGKLDRTLFIGEKWRDLQRVSYNGMDKLEEVVVASKDTPPFIRLQTLLLTRANNVNIPEGFFTLTPNLRLLDMSFIRRLSHIPESLCSVSSLRHLDLSGTHIKYIPESIGDLNSLQYLNLSMTRISNIPKELGKLTNLVVLDLSWNEDITSIPRCAVSPLVKLQILELIDTPCFLEIQEEDKGHLGLKDLYNLIQLTRVSLTIERHLDVRGLLEVAKAIRAMNIRKVNELSTDDLSMIVFKLERIKYLDIHDCPGLINRLEIPQGCLSKCATFKLFGLPLEGLAVHGQLGCLQNLYVQNCSGLKELPSLAQFPNLLILSIRGCSELVELVSVEESATISNSGDQDTNMHLSLPKLRSIYLSDLPKLASISSIPLQVPSLQEIKIQECPSLKMPLLLKINILVEKE